MPTKDPDKNRDAAREGMRRLRSRRREEAAPPPATMQQLMARLIDMAVDRLPAERGRKLQLLKKEKATRERIDTLRQALGVMEDPKYDPSRQQPPPVKNPALAVAKWAKARLVVPHGHWKSGEPMELPPYATRFFRDAFRPAIREAALLIGRKNAKSAVCAVLLLAFLDDDGPLRRLGWRCGVVSINADKAVELWQQAEDIAAASGLDIAVKPKSGEGIWFGKSPRIMRSRWGQVDFKTASNTTGHGSGYDLVLVDEIGLLDERGRGLVAGMLQSTSARDGRMIAISVTGDSPMTAELKARKRDPAVVVHEYAAPPKARLDSRKAWEAGNPGLRLGIKSYRYMEDASRKAKMLPAERAEFMTYDLNRPTSPTQDLVCDPDKLAECEVDRNKLPPRLGACWLGLDLGATLSMSAATATFQNGRTEVLCQWGDDPPLEDRQQVDGVGAVYEMAFEAGELLLSEGAEVDPRDFLQNVVRWLDGVRVAVCAFDTYKSGNVRAELEKNGLAWPLYQTFRNEGGKAHRSADINRFRLAVQQKRVLFPKPNLLLANAVARSHVHTDMHGLGELRKARNAARIDVLSSTLLAVGARDSRNNKPFRVVPMMYTSRSGAGS